MNCSTCKFWERDDQIGPRGRCRCYPPSSPPTRATKEYSGWVRTHDKDWCGAHELRTDPMGPVAYIRTGNTWEPLVKKGEKDAG